MRRVIKVLRVDKVHKEPLVLKGQQVIMVLKVDKGRKVLQDLKERQVTKCSRRTRGSR